MSVIAGLEDGKILSSGVEPMGGQVGAEAPESILLPCRELLLVAENGPVAIKESSHILEGDTAVTNVFRFSKNGFENPTKGAVGNKWLLLPQLAEGRNGDLWPHGSIRDAWESGFRSIGKDP